MQWYEFNVDNGDGTVSAWRYRTKEEAQEVRDFLETSRWFQQDGDGSPVTKVDTDSKYFWGDNITSLKEEY